MSDELTSAIEGERHKLAKALHDGLTQELAAALFYAEVVGQSVAKDDLRRLAEVRALQDVLAKANASMRAIYADLASHSGNGSSGGDARLPAFG